MEMYGDSCEILNEVRGWFKDPVPEDMGGGGGGGGGVVSIGRKEVISSKGL